MSEVVLVVLGRPETAAYLLQAGERMAELAHGAHISVLAPVELVGSPLKSAYDVWLSEPGSARFSPRWHAELQDIAGAVEERGARADVIVIARPTEDDDRATRHAFRAALLKTSRPVLVVPPGGAARDFGRDVAIAWRNDPHTARAVLPALRYIEAAARVHLLAGLKHGAPAPGIPEVLAERLVPAELHLMPLGSGIFGAALAAKVHEFGADLLVMGAYANGALHNLIYGGVTRFMLDHADFPVLMRY